MRRHVLVLASMVCSLAAPSAAPANTYTVVLDNTATWSQAQAAAVLAGGYLVTITSAAEQAAVEAAITTAAPPSDGAFWINLRETGECCYVWDTAETNCYSHFLATEPNDYADGPGGSAEDRGHLMWSSTPSRKGFWNDAPAAGFPGSSDVSRLGYVIEFGALDPAGPCGACVTVGPGTFCNTPPPGATTVVTRFTGVSTGPQSIGGEQLSSSAGRSIDRTIIDISEPSPRPWRLRPARAQATYLVSLEVPLAGVPASTVAAAFIDSINRQVGSAGFIANYANASDPALIQMYRAAGNYGSSDVNTVPGITLSTGTAPMAAWPAQAGLAMILAILARRAMRSRRRSAA